MTFSRLWLFATVPIFALGVFAIVRLAVGLVRFTREAIVVSLPVIAEQRVMLPATQRYSVLMQGKIGERGLGDLKVAVADGGGRDVPVTPVYVRSSATSIDGTVRLELFSFAATAGQHTIRVVGIDPARNYENNRVVIARSGRGQLGLRIVALVLTSVATLGALVGSSLIIAGPR
jgi:hypothetical protein